MTRAEDPASLSASLAAADAATRGRVLHELQRTQGNRYVGQLVTRIATATVASGDVRNTITVAPAGGHSDGAIRLQQVASGSGAGHVGAQLESDDPAADDAGPEPLDAVPNAPAGATEAIGPERLSTYEVKATTLAGVAEELGGREEAGHVGWTLQWSSTTNSKSVIDSVNVTADITLEMPRWTPPASMLPKARAEWSRAYGALLAHEQGHIKLVHDRMDGLAARLLGLPVRKAATVFDAARQKLAAGSAAYDAATRHGEAAGTVIDVSIEQKEIDEKRAQAPASRVPEPGSWPALPDSAGS